MARDFFLFCDDARQEMSGKYMLIGIYGDSLVTSQFPVNVTLTPVYLSHRLRGGEVLSVTYRLESGGIIGQLKLKIESPDQSSGFALLPLPELELNISSADSLLVSLAIGDADPEDIAQLRLRQGEVHTPSHRRHPAESHDN